MDNYCPHVKNLDFEALKKLFESSYAAEDPFLKAPAFKRRNSFLPDVKDAEAQAAVLRINT